MNRALVVVPTYDERENVQPLCERIFMAAPQVEILFVDDRSPDGTGELLDQMAAANPQIHVLHRRGKEGLGRAYVAGFRWALDRNYDRIVGMDADLSHDPRDIPALLAAADTADLVIGSRYLGGIRILNWPFHRLLLSKAAGTYVRWITGLPVTDPTGGYRCYRRELLRAIALDELRSNGYAFLVETVYAAWILGFHIREIPIVFEERRSGYSKMSFNVFRESAWMVWRLAVRYRFRRRPRTHPPSEGVAA